MYSICSRRRGQKLQRVRTGPNPLAIISGSRYSLSSVAKKEMLLAFVMREPITLCGIGPRDKDHHTCQCDTHLERLRRGEGLALAGNDWRSILSGLTQWGRYP